MVPSPAGKELGSHHSYPHNKTTTTKKQGKMKINYCFLIPQRIKYSRHTASLKTGETDEYKE